MSKSCPLRQASVQQSHTPDRESITTPCDGVLADGIKPKAFLRSGSGLKLRQEASSSEKRYIPRGGFIIDFSEAAEKAKPARKSGSVASPAGRQQAKAASAIKAPSAAKRASMSLKKLSHSTAGPARSSERSRSSQSAAANGMRMSQQSRIMETHSMQEDSSTLKRNNTQVASGAPLFKIRMGTFRVTY